MRPLLLRGEASDAPGLQGDEGDGPQLLYDEEPGLVAVVAHVGEGFAGVCRRGGQGGDVADGGSSERPERRGPGYADPLPDDFG